MYIHVYICVYIYICVYMYIMYIHQLYLNSKKILKKNKPFSTPKKAVNWLESHPKWRVTWPPLWAKSQPKRSILTHLTGLRRMGQGGAKSCGEGVTGRGMRWEERLWGEEAGRGVLARQQSPPPEGKPDPQFPVSETCHWYPLSQDCEK